MSFQLSINFNLKLKFQNQMNPFFFPDQDFDVIKYLNFKKQKTFDTKLRLM